MRLGETAGAQAPCAEHLRVGAPLLDAIYFAQGTATDGQSTYDITDLVGSERAVVANNAIVALYKYDPFGTRSTVSGSSTASNRGFTGFYYHGASGLQFARNRVYNSSLGRWMTRDPIGSGHAYDDPARFSATDFNLYAYAGNNPQSMVDPSGNFGLGLGANGSAGIGPGLGAGAEGGFGIFIDFSSGTISAYTNTGWGTEIVTGISVGVSFQANIALDSSSFWGNGTELGVNTTAWGLSENNTTSGPDTGFGKWNGGGAGAGPSIGADAHYFETLTVNRKTWDVASWVKSLFGDCGK